MGRRAAREGRESVLQTLEKSKPIGQIKTVSGAKPNWKPIPNSPQQLALDCQADELFFGGGAGGGKSHLLLGLGSLHHEKAIIFRREFPQLKELISESRKILQGCGSYNSQEHIWKHSGDKTLEFGAVQYEHDVERYQGRAHDAKCVGEGTLVWMSDGSKKPIEQICVGEIVLTLEGPRKVTCVITQRKPAVRVCVWRDGELIGSQVQSFTHKLLANHGSDSAWISAAELGLDPISPSCAAKQSCSCGKSAESTRSMSQFALPSHLSIPKGLLPQFLPAQRPADSVLLPLDPSPVFACSDTFACTQSGLFRATEYHCDRKSLLLSKTTLSVSRLTFSRKWIGLEPPSEFPQEMDFRQFEPDCFFGRDRTNRESGCEVFGGSPQVLPQRVLPPCAFPVVLSVNPCQSVFPSAVTAALRDDSGALAVSSPVNFLLSCSSELRQYGEQLLPDAKGGQLLTAPQSVDAVQYTPTYLPLGETGKTHKHSRYAWSYSHPYAKDKRQSSLPLLAFPYSSSCIHGVSFVDTLQIPLYDLTVEDVNHYITEIGFVNKNCFDEICHFSQLQYETLKGWARSANAAQRVRVVATGNPPANYQGQWVKEYWGAWLDVKHENPATPGELVWYVRMHDRDIEVGRGPKRPDPVMYKNELVFPISRTFIPAKVDDNPYYLASGYKKTLQAMPEPLRSQLLYGDFASGVPDDLMQLFPTEWVEAAMKRWSETPPEGLSQSAMGVDPARGGKDNSVIAERRGDWFNVYKYPGSETKSGDSLAALVVKHRFGSPTIYIDVIGVGSSPYDSLEALGLDPIALVSNGGSVANDRSGKLSFGNKRAEWAWKLREALDPDYGSQIALPDSNTLKADLTAIRWQTKKGSIWVEPKDDIRKRLGRSPDEGEAIIYASIGGEVEFWFGFGSDDAESTWAEENF